MSREASKPTISPCSCTPPPDADAPDNPACPVHGKEIQHWMAWELGERRCPYCEDQSDEDWLAMCDCFMAEEVLTLGRMP